MSYHGFESSRLRTVEVRERWLEGDGDPNGVVRAGQSVQYWDRTNKNLYVNNDGLTGWTLINTAAGVTGSGTPPQVAYWTAATVLGGDPGFTYNAATNTPTIAGGITFTGGGAVVGNAVLTVNDNVADALHISDAGGIEYLRVQSTNASEVLYLIPDGTSADTSAPGAGANSQRLGVSALADGARTVSIGDTATTPNDDSVAIGYGASVGGLESVAIGSGAGASAATCTAVGQNAIASNGGNTAIGHDALASANVAATAIGRLSSARGNYSTVIGRSASDNVRQYCVVVGYQAAATTGDSAVIIGAGSTAGSSATAIGRITTASGVSSLCLGVGAQSAGQDSVCVGPNGRSRALRSIAIGREASIAVGHSYAIAIGYQVTTAGANDCLIGGESTSVSAVDIGSGVLTPTAKLHLRTRTAATNTTSDVTIYELNSTGAPANNYGGLTRYRLESSTTDNRDAAAFIWRWSDATDATRDGEIILQAVRAASLIDMINADGGSGVVINQGGNALDFRVEDSNTQYAIFQDDGTGNLGVGASSPARRMEIEQTVVLGVSPSDDYAAALRLDPGYDDSGSGYTVARHNYIEMQDVQLLNSAAVTDGCAIAFDAVAGTHSALDSGTTKTTPGTVNAWVKINISGTVYYIPAYTSKTA